MILSLSALREERHALRTALGLKASGTLQGLELDTGSGWTHLCFGMGAERLKGALELGLEVFAPKFVVLVGFSVALRPELRVGDLLCDSRSNEEVLKYLRNCSSLSVRLAEVQEAGFLHSVSEKVAFAKDYPQAELADLETASFFSILAGRVPSLALRAVSDELETSLPLNFGEFVNARGFPDMPGILGQLARRPHTVPKLIRLGRDANVAAVRLGSALTCLEPFLSKFQGPDRS